jgi:hypothetical protein
MNRCPACGTPTAPSWTFCPKCAAPLQAENEGDASQARDPERPTDATPPSQARSITWLKSVFGRRLGLILILLALDTVLVLVAINDVVIRDQLRTTHSSLASATTRLTDSQVSLRILNRRFQATQRQNAAAQSSTLAQQTQVQGELQGVLDLLQGTTGNSGTTVGAISTVHGVGATLVFTSVQTPSTVSLTAIVTGASPGRTYALGLGRCPEDVSSRIFAASAVAIPDGFVILPTIHVDVPANGGEFWLRLHEITPSGSTVLGGVADAYVRQGESLGNGSPVPPTRAAC